MGTQEEKLSTSLKDLFQNIKNKKEHIYGWTYSEATISLKQMYRIEDSDRRLFWMSLLAHNHSLRMTHSLASVHID